MMGAKIGVDLNVFEILATSDRPLSTVELAIATCVEPDLLLRLLKFMSSIGLIKEVQSNLWGPSNATRNLASRHIAAGVNHKYVKISLSIQTPFDLAFHVLTRSCRHDNVMPAWHALPSWLNRRDYKSPTATTNTPFSQGHGAPPEQSFFSWLKEHPWNANEFNLFMNVHRTGVKTWLDLREVVELFQWDLAMLYANFSPKNDPAKQYVFVDVGGGIGQQCKVWIRSYLFFNWSGSYG
jgi:hypothetical protein